MVSIVWVVYQIIKEQDTAGRNVLVQQCQGVNCTCKAALLVYWDLMRCTVLLFTVLHFISNCAEYVDVVTRGTIKHLLHNLHMLSALQ